MFSSISRVNGILLCFIVLNDIVDKYPFVRAAMTYIMSFLLSLLGEASKHDINNESTINCTSCIRLFLSTASQHFIEFKWNMSRNIMECHQQKSIIMTNCYICEKFLLSLREIV